MKTILKRFLAAAPVLVSLLVFSVRAHSEGVDELMYKEFKFDTSWGGNVVSKDSLRDDFSLLMNQFARGLTGVAFRSLDTEVFDIDGHVLIRGSLARRQPTAESGNKYILAEKRAVLGLAPAVCTRYYFGEHYRGYLQRIMQDLSANGLINSFEVNWYGGRPGCPAGYDQYFEIIVTYDTFERRPDGLN